MTTKPLKTARGTGHQKNFLEASKQEDTYEDEKGNMGRTNPKRLRKMIERTTI